MVVLQLNERELVLFSGTTCFEHLQLSFCELVAASGGMGHFLAL